MRASNADQIAYWNSRVGETWVNFQPMLDQQISPLGAQALRVLAPRPGEAILDIGCGCGETTLDLARATGAAGRVLGVDVSAAMLGVARARAARAGLPQAYFHAADAAVAEFGACFDAAFSRFGVMFFADPVGAFANIAAGLRPGARLVFVCWRPAAENPWFMVPFQAAAPLLPPLPPADPLAPGPFAFADETRIHSVLAAAGFVDISTTKFNAMIGGFDPEGAARLAMRVGPLGAALRDAPDLGPALKASVRAAMARHARPDGVFLESATWIVQARR